MAPCAGDAVGPAEDLGSGRVHGQAHFKAAQLLPVCCQDPLGSVVPVGEPEGQVYVRQVELRLWQRVVPL